MKLFHPADKINRFRLVILLPCFVFVLSGLKAQPPGDPSWNSTPFFFDDFTSSGRVWDGNWFDVPQFKWRGHMAASGCYHGRDSEWQVYQPHMLQFKPNEGVLKLVSSIENGPMDCGDYQVPPGYACEPGYPKLYCFSGAMEVLNPGDFLYGYFEIRCKLPIHRGAFPAFWLYQESDGEYREIDIFEYSYGLNQGDGRTITAQIYYQKSDETQISTYRLYRNTLAAEELDLSAWHTFGLDWSPGRVVFYVDGLATHSYTGNGVPDKPMGLIVNYAIDNWVSQDLGGGEIIFNPPIDFPSEMIVDYVLVKKLKLNCSSSFLVGNQSELNSFEGSYYGQFSVNPQSAPLSFGSFPFSVIRSGEITLHGGVEVPIGKEMEFITHACSQ